MWGGIQKDDKPKRLEIQVRNLDEERSSTGATSGLTSVTNSMDSLLRLFRSDFFDAFMAVTYLYRYRETRGVHDYLCNELYVLSDADLEVFMPQLCNLLVHHAPNSPGLERFVMDKCASSMHFSVQVYWFLQAAVEDAVREKNKETEERCRHLRTQCETAAVNGSQYALRSALSTRAFLDSPASKILNVNGNDQDTRDKSVNKSDDCKNELANKTADTPSAKRLAVEEDVDNEKPARDQESDYNDDPIPVMDSAELSMDGQAILENANGNLNGISKQLSAETDSLSEKNNLSTEENLNSTVSKDTDQNAIEVHSSDENKPNKNMDSTVDASVKADVTKAQPSERSTTAEPDIKESFEAVPIDNAEDETPNVVEIIEAPCDITSEKMSAEQPDDVKSVLKQQANDNNSNSVEAKDKVTQTQTPSKNREKNLKKDVGALESLDMDPLQLVRMKQERFDYFQDSLAIIKLLVQLSLSTRDQTDLNRWTHLVQGLYGVNDMLFRRMCGESAEPLVAGTRAPTPEEVVALGRGAALRSIHLPLTRADSQVLRILRVLPEESVILTSRTRCPYLLYVEVLPTAMECSDRLVFCEHMGVGHTPDPQARRRISSSREPKAKKIWNSSSIEELPNSEDITATPVSDSGTAKRSRRKLSEMTPMERQRANVRAIIYGDPYSDQPDNFAKADREDLTTESSEADRRSRQAALLVVFGELWSWKEERILKKSPFTDLKDSKLMSFIVKAGDDLRQEQLAIQLIKQFDLIFKEEDVDVFLKPFTVMSVSSDAGLVEVMPDSVSVHSLKGKTPNFRSLLDYFERAYGPVGTASFRAAQRRFIRSMAGYSLVCYFLQIKDRHNGNIMIDARGHIVHIDFGFMLTNSPGAIKFENAPFKLTEEYLQVICAMKNVSDITETSKTEGFRFFQELFVLGLLAARKHHDKITTLVRIMMDGTSMPCMISGTQVIEGLEARFALGMPEKQCISHAISLIESSRLSFRSVGYDRFQAYSNGYR